MHQPRALLAGALPTLVLALAACSGGGAAASVSAPPGTEATITAHNFSFDPAEVRVPAGQTVGLFFRNLDGEPHNVAIYTDASATASRFVGDTIKDAATVYEVPALEPGSYLFRCDVHPNMTGSFVVEG